MGKLQRLGADTICNIVAFALGADIVALLTTSRHVRATLAGPVARKHFQALSIARWGEGCRCHYATATKHLQEGDDATRGVSSNAAVRSSTGGIARTAEKVGGDDGSGGHEDLTKEDNADWLAFYLRRAGHRAVQPSPLDLLQEHYTEDAYRLLSCCILCSRTSGGDTVKAAVAAFFRACPTPTSVLSADQEELRKTLLPLGLNREAIIKRFAEGFLTTPWHDPSELHGCGRFASDSWQIFCLGSCRPGDQVVAAADADAAKSAKKKSGNAGRRGSLDRNLAAYCRYALRSAADVEGEGGAAAAGEEDSARVRKDGAGGRGAAATMSLGGAKKRKGATVSSSGLREDGSASMEPRRRSRLKSDKRPARWPRAEGAGRSSRGVSAGASSQARPWKVGVGIAREVAGGVTSTREERALRRSLRGR
eukprot:g3204.t1